MGWIYPRHTTDIVSSADRARARKGTVLGRYEGERLTDAQFKARYPKGGPLPHRAVCIGAFYIDGATTEHWTSKVMSPYGTTHKANVELTSTGTIRAKRDIGAYAELYLAYGGTFWAAHRKKH